ncbi:MAG: flagellar hook-length control protein FliK [Nitrospirae bacterium]|nr:flagellar hook-length control protein FliK [Nitrospirota bacterium]
MLIATAIGMSDIQMITKMDQGGVNPSQLKPSTEENPNQQGGIFNIMLVNMMDKGSTDDSVTSETANNQLNVDNVLVVNYLGLLGLTSSLVQPKGQGNGTGNLPKVNQQTVNPNETAANATNLIQLDISSLLQLNGQSNSIQSNEQTVNLQGAATNEMKLIQEQIAALVGKSGQASKEPSAQAPDNKDALSKLLSSNKGNQSEGLFNKKMALNENSQNGVEIKELLLNNTLASVIKADSDSFLGSSKEGQTGMNRLESNNSQTSSLPNMHPIGEHTPKVSLTAGNAPEVRMQKLLNINDTIFSVLRKSDNSIEIRVEPDGIGKLDIGLSVDKGVIHAQISATEPAGKELIEKNLRQILDTLAKEGISVGGFSVSLKDKRGEFFKDEKNVRYGDTSEGVAVEETASNKPNSVANYGNNGKINIFA